jgi:hypothetical protein
MLHCHNFCAKHGRLTQFVDCFFDNKQIGAELTYKTNPVRERRSTTQKLPPEIFRHLTENQSIFWISPENGPFSGFFSDTKIRTFLEKLFLEIS